MTSSRPSMLRRFWRWLFPKRLPASGRYTSLGRPAALTQLELNDMARTHHPLLVGLFAELPEPYTEFDNQGDWLHAARCILPQVYRTLAPPVLAASPRDAAASTTPSGDVSESVTPEEPWGA